MGTKNRPGDFDCYANAEPDEPMFILLARDEKAPEIVRAWVTKRYVARNLPNDMGPFKYDEKEREALACAAAMEKWRAANPGPYPLDRYVSGEAPKVGDLVRLHNDAGDDGLTGRVVKVNGALVSVDIPDDEGFTVQARYLVKVV